MSNSLNKVFASRNNANGEETYSFLDSPVKLRALKQMISLLQTTKKEEVKSSAEVS
jgi:hypothetical protein